MQNENFGKVGIRPPLMYASQANQDGGYHKVGYLKKDVHNQLARQRREHASDVSGALKYLAYLMSKDPLMFVSYTVNDDNTIGCNICFGNHHIQLTIVTTTG